MGNRFDSLMRTAVHLNQETTQLRHKGQASFCKPIKLKQNDLELLIS